MGEGILWTQKVKFAKVSSLCARWSYSTNCATSVGACVDKRCRSYAAAGAPSSTSALVCPGGRKLPRPLELDRGVAARSIVADELDLWVLVQIGVGMEFARDQIVKLS